MAYLIVGVSLIAAAVSIFACIRSFREISYATEKGARTTAWLWVVVSVYCAAKTCVYIGEYRLGMSISFAIAGFFNILNASDYFRQSKEFRASQEIKWESFPVLDPVPKAMAELAKIRKERRVLDQRAHELEAKLEPAGFREPAIQLEAVVKVPVEVSKK